MVRKIAITGTKGKTTAVAIVADVLQKMQMNVLKVDTTGHYVNGEQKSTLDDSKSIWNLVPTVSPGRYLYEFFVNPELQKNGVAVLETAIGSSSSSGLGYRYHEVGVFLNVFEDHLGSSSRLQTQADIAHAKQFIFERLHKSGSYAVFNADDPLVVSRLEVVPKEAEVNLLPFGLSFSQFDINTHLQAGGEAVTIADGAVVLRNKAGDRRLAELSRIPWTFDGAYEPSLWNLMAAVGAIYGYFAGELPEGVQDVIESVRLDPYGGRLTVLRARNGAKIIADYAHEKISLGKIGDLARGQVGKGGRAIGVVRLAHDRTDELIHETGAIVGRHFDSVVVYEKIDGYWRKPAVIAHSKFPQIIGRTSQIFFEGVQSTNQESVRIEREDEAIAHAASIAGPNDVVVVIVNDDIRRSLDFIQKSFEAEFI